jgi:hypothetical protein
MEEIKDLIENKWKFFDESEQRKKKAMTMIPLLFFVFFMLYMVIHFMFAIFNVSFDTILNKLIISIIFVILIMFITAVKISGMDQDKTDWYFAALQDRRLQHESMLGFMRKFLKDRKYQFEMSETKRTVDLFITYFDLPGEDFKTRLWFTKLRGIPTVEIGIGPETGINKNILEKLRKEFATEFKKAFGS